MKVETKFELEQDVFFVDFDNITKTGKITEVHCDLSENVKIIYKVKNDKNEDFYVPENSLFLTEDEAYNEFLFKLIKGTKYTLIKNDLN